MYRKGEKIVCVEPVNDLVRDRTYTVIRSGEIAGVPMVEVDRTACCFLAFYARRFRRVVLKKTNISEFTALLTPTEEMADV